MRSTLVGRTDELRGARHALDRHGVVVLTGPSGVGKTAICDVLSAEWVAGGGVTRELRGTHGLAGVPFGALTLALRVEPGDSPAETLGRVVTALTGSDGRPLVIVDDAHLLDDESAGLVSGLAQSSEVALALAITSGERVSADVTSVWARWTEARIEVEPLTRDGVGELLGLLLEVPVADELVDSVSDVSLGYPLYVSAIAAELNARNTTDVAQILQLGASSDRLTRLMERRLARLDRDERGLFDAVAFAESLPESVVAAISNPEVVQRLVDSGLVTRKANRVRVDHPLLGSVARETLTVEGRRTNARLLLEAAGEGLDRGDTSSLVRKALGVGVRPSNEHLRMAAEAAFDWGDFDGVARLTALAPDDPGLVVLRAQAGRFLGETPPSEIPVGLDEEALTEYLSGASQAMAYVERRFSDAIDFLRAGMVRVADPNLQDRLALELMVLSGLVGDLDALLGAARAVSPEADGSTRMLALSATQLAEALTLSTSSSNDTYQTGLAVAAEAKVDEFLVEQLEMSRVTVELAEGRFGEARSRSDAYESKTLIGSWLTIEAVLADAWLPIGEASALAVRAVAALEEFDPLGNLAQARIVADLRQAQLGKALDEIEATSHEEGVAGIDRIMNQRVDCWLEWAQDDSTAGKRLIEVGQEAIAMGHRLWGLSALIDAVRLGHGESAAPDIEQLAITRGAGLAVLASRHARARTSEEYSASARMWWEAGAPTYAIETALNAIDSDDPAGRLTVDLMAANGAKPVVGEVAGISRPLSDRQMDVVGLALENRSNDEIAEELFLSRRTVENHLHRVYTTLSLPDGRDGLIRLYGWLREGAVSRVGPETSGS